MKLHINSEVNPWPYGHKTLAQINVLPHDPDKPFTYDGKKYKFWPNNPGTIYEVQLMFIDYDAPKATEAGLPPLKTEKYLWYHNAPVDLNLIKSIRYVDYIRLIKQSVQEQYDTLNLKKFTELMEEKTNFAIHCCDLLP